MGKTGDNHALGEFLRLVVACIGLGVSEARCHDHEDSDSCSMDNARAASVVLNSRARRIIEQYYP